MMGNWLENALIQDNPFAEFGMPYASEYEERLYELLWIIEVLFDLKFPLQQVDSALIQNNLMSQDIYADISAGTYTDRLARFEATLGLPQHTFVNRGLELKGNIVDADEMSVRWLPEG